MNNEPKYKYNPEIETCDEMRLYYGYEQIPYSQDQCKSCEIREICQEMDS